MFSVILAKYCPLWFHLSELVQRGTYMYMYSITLYTQCHIIHTVYIYIALWTLIGYTYRQCQYWKKYLHFTMVAQGCIQVHSCHMSRMTPDMIPAHTVWYNTSMCLLENGPVLGIPSHEGAFLLACADVPDNDVLWWVGVLHYVTERHQVPINTRGGGRGEGRGGEGEGAHFS